MQALLLTSVKNEGAFLLDWLAWHFTLGFTWAFVLSNDCTDGTDAMLDRLAALGHLTHQPNPGPHAKSPQWDALDRAARHKSVKSADWVLVADVDEYLNIHQGGGRLSDLLSALPAADAITLTWRLFGNDGVLGFQDRPVPAQFTRAAPRILAWPWRAQMFKTLYRPATFAKPGVHRPRGAKGDARWFDGSGRDVTGSLGTRVFSDYRQHNYALAQINHYPLQSAESFIVKADRGRANREGDGSDLDYWVERNLSAEEDRSILARTELQEKAAALVAKWRADPVLGDLHRDAVVWRQRRFAALMQRDETRALFGRLLMSGPSRVLTPKEAAILQRFRQVP